MNECPFCGEKRNEHNDVNLQFYCDTWQNEDGKWFRTSSCYEGEIYLLKLELEELEKAKADLAKRVKTLEEQKKAYQGGMRIWNSGKLG